MFFRLFRSTGLAALSLCFVLGVSSRYTPDWQSLDSRPLPQWFDDAKVGMFFTWGVYSVPGFGNEWFWYNWKEGDPATVEFMKNNYPPGFTYADFAPSFRAEFYNPDEWADIVEASGARYVVLTTKTHEGFTNWPSKVSWNWNAADVGPKRDLVGDFSAAIRKKGKIRLGFYHSQDEFFNPLYLADRETGFKTHRFPKEKSIPEVYELVNMYKPDLLWSDFWTFDSTDVYFNSTDVVAWLYNDSPVKDTIVTNDRWGGNTICKHGGYYTCQDQYDPGHLVEHKWECCWPLDAHSWGIRRNAHSTDFRTTHDMITKLARVVSCGGNLLINVGPNADGMINPLFEDRLREFGGWMKINGEAIYSSKPWIHQNDANSTFVWYTSKKTVTGTSVYAITLSWPPKGELLLGSVTTAGRQTTVTMLGYPDQMSWEPASPSGIVVHVPPISPDQIPSRLAWVFRIDNLE